MEWTRQINKDGVEYFENAYTGEKVFTKGSYSQEAHIQKDETNSYIIINTLDGQVKIPEDALPGLNKWSGRMNMLTTYRTEETIPTFNVSSSYLTRLISISRASFQHFSLEDDEELMEKKRQQIVSMFDAHDSDEFTRFYDEEMEMTNDIKEFMKTMGVVKVKHLSKWAIPSDVLMYSIGRIVDTMDPSFTDAQYVTIAALSYFHHLKETKPEAVEGFSLKITLLENKIRPDIWIPLNIQSYISGIFMEPLKLQGSTDEISGLMTQVRGNPKYPQNVRDFWGGLSKLLHECKYPVSRRVWLE